LPGKKGHRIGEDPGPFKNFTGTLGFGEGDSQNFPGAIGQEGKNPRKRKGELPGKRFLIPFGKRTGGPTISTGFLNPFSAQKAKNLAELLPRIPDPGGQGPIGTFQLFQANFWGKLWEISKPREPRKFWGNWPQGARGQGARGKGKGQG